MYYAVACSHHVAGAVLRLDQLRVVAAYSADMFVVILKHLGDLQLQITSFKCN
jgi:uncharacterized membrane protein YhhN